jgi:hypothetical protein
MEIFISWSGPRSHAVAKALRDWLPKIINALKPWLSSADIDKGARWGVDVAGRLEAARAGIICVTRSNLGSEWLLFEAGALSKTVQHTFVCPLLIGLEPSDIKGPLAQFQATKATKDDLLRMVKTLNASLRDGALPDAHIEEAFEVWWPKLASTLDTLPSEKTSARPTRSEKDLLEEILSLVRTQTRYFQLSFTAPEFLFGGREPRPKERRAQDITSTISRVIHSAERDLKEITVSVGKSDVNFTVEPRDRQPYSVVVPLDTAQAEIESLVESQIPPKVSLPPPDSPPKPK